MQMYDIGLIGATGLVGTTLLKIFEERAFPIKSLRLFASEKSEGFKVKFAGENLTVEKLSPQRLDYAFFCVDAGSAAQFAPLFVRKGCVVIDNSSEFRLNKNVPLIVPEINPKEAFCHNGIIANPNCSTIQAAVVLGALDREFGLKRVVISTYQAVSGAGADAISDLETVTVENLKKLPFIIKENVMPLIGSAEENHYSTEENKLIKELRKILSKPLLGVSPTAVRVPVKNCHSESVNAEFEKVITVSKATEILARAQGVKLFYEEIPTPLNTDGSNFVHVGRLRQDYSRANTLNMWITADNIRKGAALNAVQIAELLVN